MDSGTFLIHITDIIVIIVAVRRPRLTVYAPPSVPRLEVPEFDVEWVEYAVDPPLETMGDGRYRADLVVRWLASLGGPRPVVYVVEGDAYVPGLNFVFGLAMPDLGVAAVFTARLMGPRFLERLVKEITHEAGHLYGLGHCADPRCVMSFSNSVADVDAKTPMFCPRCRARLYARVR